MHDTFEWRLRLICQGVFQCGDRTLLKPTLRWLDGCLTRLVAEPPPPAIGSLMQGDAVYPCLEAGASMEVLHPAKHFQEDFLRCVGSIRRIQDDAIDETIHRLVECPDQPGLRFVSSGLYLGYKAGFMRPAWQRSCDVTHAYNYRHYSHGVTTLL